MARVDPPYEFIAHGLIAGEVPVPFFGAGASAVYRVIRRTVGARQAVLARSAASLL